MLHPKNDFILIKRAAREDKTPGGLSIPEAAQPQQDRGEVLAVGPGVVHDGQRIPVDVCAGDVVLFTRYGGTDVKVAGETFVLVRETEIYGVLS